MATLATRVRRSAAIVPEVSVLIERAAADHGEVRLRDFVVCALRAVAVAGSRLKAHEAPFFAAAALQSALGAELHVAFSATVRAVFPSPESVREFCVALAAGLATPPPRDDNPLEFARQRLLVDLRAADAASPVRTLLALVTLVRGLAAARGPDGRAYPPAEFAPALAAGAFALVPGLDPTSAALAAEPALSAFVAAVAAALPAPDS